MFKYVLTDGVKMTDLYFSVQIVIKNLFLEIHCVDVVNYIVKNATQKMKISLKQRSLKNDLSCKNRTFSNKASPCFQMPDFLQHTKPLPFLHVF